MSITKIGNVYRVEIRYKDSNGDNLRVTKSGFKTKKEAASWEIDKAHQLKKNPNITFSLLVEQYLEDAAVRVKPNTLLIIRNIIKNKLIPNFGNIKINEITPSIVRKWQNELLATNNSAAYNRSINNVFIVIMKFAVVMYDLPNNPVKVCGKFGSREGKGEIIVYNKEEFETFLIAFQKNKYYYPILLLYYTGIRFGELLALTKNDFNFNENSLSITKSLTIIGKEKIITTPKTKTSVRKIVVPDICINEIKKYIAMQYDLKDNDLLFTFSRTAFRKAIYKVCDNLGFARITVHGFRHSHCSHLINSGVSILDIAKRLGHKNEEITLYYSHLFKDKHDLEYEKKYINDVFRR